jgi:F-type H+-transporting ATPase subunit gamma
MAKARALDRRRRAIKNIRKITRTMELIATARFKRAMDRASAATAYTRRMSALVAHLAKSGLEVTHPLLEPRPETRRAVLLVLSANRGLCGGYNASVIRTAIARFAAMKNEVPEVALEVSGKRGISGFRFRGYSMAQRYMHFEDKPSYDEAAVLAERYLREYTSGQIDRLDVAYTKFESISRQHAVVETLLPIGEVPGADENEATAAEPQYEFLPSARSILDEVVPASFRMRIFKCLLDAAVTEQIARMVAMKGATENADAMIGSLTMTYNRARQSQITNDILEVIGGAEALSQ